MKPAGYWTAAALIAVFYMGSTLPTPLYVVYQREFGFSHLVLTLIYAAYAVGNLGALFLFGQASDHLGRRRVTLGALAVAALSMVIFLLAGSAAALALARMVSGLAIAIAAATITAWLTELEPHGDKARAARIAVIFNFLGLGIGALVGGVLDQPYVVGLALIGVMAVVTLRQPERVADKKGTGRAQLNVPRELRARFFPPAATAFATFATIGYYAALAPSILKDSLHQESRILAGGIVAELCLIAAATILVTARMDSRRAMSLGLILFLPSLALTAGAQVLESPLLLAAASGLTGIAAAMGFRGSLEAVNHLAPPDRRAGILSSYLVACYGSNSLPIIGIGIAAEFFGAKTAGIGFAVIIALVVIAALQPSNRNPG